MNVVDNTGSSEAVLDVRALRKRFGTFEALQSIQFRLNAGQILGMLGPNGAGKTTTLRLITGSLRPTSGTIRVCGFNATTEPTRAKQCIGFVGDRPYLYEKLTGSEFLRFVGGLWGMTSSAIRRGSDEWLGYFDLQGWAGQTIEAYSHGMRQRLLLCAALIHEPKLLILDEPMVGLDPRGAVRLKELLRQLADTRNMGILLSTHSLDVVEQVCDSMMVIDRGTVVASGTLNEVRTTHHAQGRSLEELFLLLTERAQRTSSTDLDPQSNPS